ncbi:MAG: hypothetical protein ACIALR_09805 [Blastopirellula sp. JB062]
MHNADRATGRSKKRSTSVERFFFASTACQAGLVTNDSFRDTAPPLVRGQAVRYGIFCEKGLSVVVRLASLLLILAIVAGCHALRLPSWIGAGKAAPYVVENPMYAQFGDYDVLWEQIVDSIDDNFKIKDEQRVRVIAGQLTEGRLETYPTVGSTLLEPWRTDSTRGYEKLESTLQTIRRIAIVHVMPEPGGFLIEVEVQKQLEDMHGRRTDVDDLDLLRHDGTLRNEPEPEIRSTAVLGWIPIGRDFELEQRLLRDIRARLAACGAPPQERMPARLPPPTN